MELKDFEFYQNFLLKESGLALTSDKIYLIESRLLPIIRERGFENLGALTQILRFTPPTDLVKTVVEAMTTNETSFFRDQKPFERFMETVLPFLVENRQKTTPIDIWCAACSTGQEPYSLAMDLKENINLTQGWKFNITGTDISEEVLDKASKGGYSQLEVQRGLPIKLLMKYFEKRDDTWFIKEGIRNMIKFRYLNLLESMATMGMFDVIFCRNVLIYFNEKTKADVLKRLSSCLRPDGFLILGGAETVLGAGDSFIPMPDKRGLYIKKEFSSVKPEKPALKFQQKSV